MDHVRVHPKFLHSNATSHKWVLGGNLAVSSYKTLCLYMQPYMLDWRHCLNLGFIEVKCSDLLDVCVCVYILAAFAELLDNSLDEVFSKL